MLLGSAVLFSIARSLMAGRLSSVEFLLVVLLTGLVFVGMAIGLADENAFDPVLELIDSTVINKMGTDSGRERTYWNVKSLQSLVDTGGLGVGLGSSRASSWPVAVVSQLGLGGALLMARAPGGDRARPRPPAAASSIPRPARSSPACAPAPWPAWSPGR